MKLDDTLILHGGVSTDARNQETQDWTARIDGESLILSFHSMSPGEERPELEVRVGRRDVARLVDAIGAELPGGPLLLARALAVGAGRLYTDLADMHSDLDELVEPVKRWEFASGARLPDPHEYRDEQAQQDEQESEDAIQVSVVLQDVADRLWGVIGPPRPDVSSGSG